MCGRYNLYEPPSFWLPPDTALRLDNWQPRYNIAPGQFAPVIREAGQEREALMMWWGFVPHWMKEENPKTRPINARAETAASKPFFRDAMAHRRCVIPATGFYEWEKTANGKTPWLIRDSHHGPLYFAGIWDQWQTAPRGPVTTYAILTTQANQDISSIHQRMPVVLPADGLAEWLGTGNLGFLRPAPPESLTLSRISQRVNNPQNDDPTVLESGQR